MRSAAPNLDPASTHQGFGGCENDGQDQAGRARGLALGEQDDEDATGADAPTDAPALRFL